MVGGGGGGNEGGGRDARAGGGGGNGGSRESESDARVIARSLAWMSVSIWVTTGGCEGSS